MSKLGEVEVNIIISYIGVHSGGYLGDFTYASHAEFYPTYCDLNINPYEYAGSTRARFNQILLNSNSKDQSKILLGILEKYPLHNFEDKLQQDIITLKEYENKKRLHDKIIQLIAQLRGEVIEQGELLHDIEFVKEVLQQAETLITNHSYSSAVDRAHTALHGYLTVLCNEQNITFNNQNVKIQDMWSKLKTEHPSFNIDVREHQKPINQTVNAIGKFLENMNEIRNDHGFSHPNEDIIEENEARFIINLSRVLLFYIDSKTNQ